MSQNVRASLKGTGVAIVTPFTTDKEVDYNSLNKLVNFIIDGGVQYIVALGTTGETPTLTQEEKQQIVRFISTSINNRVPLVIGMGGNNTQALIQEGQAFDFCDAIAILSASPYYNKPSQQGLYEHYAAFANAMPLPVLLYNVPGRTGRNMEAATTLKLAHDVSNIIGIKEAAANLDQCREIMNQKPANFLVLSGDDDLACEQCMMGMDGVISVAANCFPGQFSNMIHTARQKDQSANAINALLHPAYSMLFEENNPAGVKAFLNEMSYCEEVLRLPLTPVSKELRERIKTFVASP